MKLWELLKIEKEHYQDPTAEDPRWVVVDLVPVEKLPKTVTLKTIKSDPILQHMALVKLSRLSVVPVKAEEFDRILELANEN